MVKKKKGRMTTKPRKPPEGYTRRPNDGIIDYHQTIKRGNFPQGRKRYYKIDGYETELNIQPDRKAGNGPLAGIKEGEERTITRGNRKITFKGTKPHGKNNNLSATIVKTEIITKKKSKGGGKKKKG